MAGPELWFMAMPMHLFLNNTFTAVLIKRSEEEFFVLIITVYQNDLVVA